MLEGLGSSNGFLAKEMSLYAEVNTENVLRSVAKVAYLGAGKVG